MKKSKSVSARLTMGMATEFSEKASTHGGVTVVLREFVKAYLEDRMIVNPPSLKGTLFEKGTQNES